MSFAGRLVRPTVAAAVVATGYGYSAYASPLKADEALPRQSAFIRPGRSASGDKLPIYPTPESEPVVTLVEVENPIAPYIAQARVATQDVLSGAGGYVRTGVSKWISFERSAEREIKSVLPHDESLTPGIIYVLIAGLSGSVLTRTRSFPVRLLAPPLFTLAALPYFLPKTSSSLRSYISNIEDKNFPEFAEKHDIFNERLALHWGMLQNKLGSAGDDARSWGSKAVQGIESSTGLKVGDVVRKGRERVEHEREKLQGRIQVGEEPVKVQTVGYVVETKPVAEIVAPVPVSTPASTPVPAPTPAPATAAIALPAAVPESKPVAVAVVPPPTPVETKKDEGKRLV